MQAPTAVTITPATAAVAPGGMLQLTATVTGNANTAVTWNPSAGAISACSSVSDQTTCTYTPPAAPGTYQVVATSVADASASAVATVTVTADANFVGTWLGNDTLTINGQMTNLGSSDYPIAADGPNELTVELCGTQTRPSPAASAGLPAVLQTSVGDCGASESALRLPVSPPGFVLRTAPLPTAAPQDQPPVLLEASDYCTVHPRLGQLPELSALYVWAQPALF